MLLHVGVSRVGASMQHFSWVEPFHLSLGLGLLLLTAAGWFAYFWSKEHGRPEERWLRLAAGASGCLAVAAALVGYQTAAALGLTASWQELVTSGLRTAARISLLIGSIEEVAKLLMALPVAWVLRRQMNPRTGIILAACAGVGFATAESAFLMSLGELGLREGLARAAAAPVTHALFAAPWGLGLAATLSARSGAGRFALGLGLAMSVLSHALYDFLLSRPGYPPAVAAPVVLTLWIWLMTQTPPSPAKGPAVAARPSGLSQPA